jgi:hypothetical protein
MRENPWMVIDLLTGETLGWYHTSEEAWLTHNDEPVDVQYRPGRKKKVKK